MTDPKKISDLNDLPDPETDDRLEISTTSQATPESRSVRVDTLRGGLTDANDVTADREAGSALVGNSNGAAYINARPLIRLEDGRVVAAPVEDVVFSSDDPEYTADSGFVTIFTLGATAGFEVATASSSQTGESLDEILQAQGLAVDSLIEIKGPSGDRVVGLWQVTELQGPSLIATQLEAPNGLFSGGPGIVDIPATDFEFDLLGPDQPELKQRQTGEAVLLPLRGDLSGTLPAFGQTLPTEVYPALAELFGEPDGPPVDTEVTIVPPLPPNAGFDVAFTPDGSLLAVAHVGGDKLTVLNTSDWSEVSGVPSLPNTGNGVAFSPDGSLLAVAHSGGDCLTVLNTSDWSEVSGVPPLPSTGRGVAFSPDGSLLAVGHRDGDGLTVLNPSDWSEVSGVPALPDDGRGVAFSPDNSFLAAGHAGGDGLTVLTAEGLPPAFDMPDIPSPAQGILEWRIYTGE